MAEVKNNTAHFMYGIADVYARYEWTAAKQAGLLESQSDKDLEEVRRLEKEKHARIQSLSLNSNSLRNWGIVSTIAQKVTAITALGVGAAACFGKEESRPAGYLLVASGVTNLANSFFNYIGAYDKVSSWLTSSKQMQETIASRLESGMQYASTALGLAGGFLSVQTGALTEGISNTISTAAYFGAKAINIGQSLAQRESSHINSEMQYVELNIHQIYQRLQQFAKEGERLTNSIGVSAHSLKNMIDNLFPS